MASEEKRRLLDSDLDSDGPPIPSSSVQDSSPFTTRKRTSAKTRDVWDETKRSETNIDVPLPELDFNDPNFLELLREYEKDERECKDGTREFELLKAQVRRKQGIGQGTAYMILIGFIVLFVVVVNWYNGKQLERLKEEYGLGDEKKVQPEYWWKRASIYTIYVPSYRDSNGDGFGDLNGIREHIDHLTYLGIDAVLLSSFLDSPFDDFGRDVVDFKSVSKRTGTMNDFDLLIKELHDRGIKVIIELVPNHTHRLHKWFSKSRLGNTAENSRYKNYYIWHKGKTLSNGTTVPPNNWLCRAGGSAWTWDDMRNEFYYHYYHPNLPDLNHRNLHVREEIIDVYSYWLDKGVDALYIDSVHALYEVNDLDLNEPINIKSSAGSAEFDSLDHIYTEDQSDVHDYYGMWREFLENYSIKSGRRVGMIADVWDDTVTDIIKYYFTGIDLPLSHALVDLTHGCGGRCTHELLDLWLVHIPQGHDAMWTLGGTERGRLTSRLDSLYQNTLNILAMLLPGANVMYYGDELSMLPLNQTDKKRGSTEAASSSSSLYDNVRLSSRGLMQWSADERMNCGFSKSLNTWIQAAAVKSCIHNNVQTQMSEPSGRSTLQIFHRLTRLRKERSFTVGKLQFTLVNDQILSFMRFAKDSAPYLIALNLGNVTSTDDYTLSAGVAYGKVVLAAVRDPLVEGIQPAELEQENLAGGLREDLGGGAGYIREGEKVNLVRLTLRPGEGVVVILLMDDVDFSSM